MIFNFNSADMIATGTDQYRLAGMPKDSIDKRMRYRTKEENTFAASLGGENKLTDAVLDYKIGYTRTEERVDDEIEVALQAQREGLQWHAGPAQPPAHLHLRQSDQWLDNANYKFDRVVAKPKQVERRGAQRAGQHALRRRQQQLQVRPARALARP
ncbi:MAG: hypothetical protein PBU97_09235 [Stenotrophomonas maltophilia]